MKKNLFFSGLIALIVSFSSFGILNYFEKEDESIKIEHIQKVPSQNALFSYDKDGNAVPVDFNKTASEVLNGVVHIKSTQLNKSASQNYSFKSIPDPFKDFFGNGFKREFYFPQKDSRINPSRIGTGSGVIISDDGFIITNNHVIDNSDDIEITIHDNRTFKASIVGTDPSTDLALLKIEARDLPTVPFTNSEQVEVGQWVLAVGNPMGLNSTVTAGIISAKGRNINILKDKYAVENFIQTDAAINPGNSGGALVNLDGGLVGINTAIASPTGSFAGYGFAIPSNIVQKVITDLMEFGTVQRGVLGVMIRTVDSKLAKEKSLNVIRGVYVDSLIEKGAALNAGLKEGDVIYKVNNLDISTSAELQGAIAQYRPGEVVKVHVYRDGKDKLFDVKLRNRKGGLDELSKEAGQLLKLLGASMENISEEMKTEYKIDHGVRVHKIFPGKLKQQTKMEEGFIITHVDNKKVKDLSALVDILTAKKGGIMLEGIYPEFADKHYYAIGL